MAIVLPRKAKMAKGRKKKKGVKRTVPLTPPTPMTQPRRRYVVTVILLVVLLLLGFLYYDSNTRLVTTEYVLEYENLPEAFDGYRIAMLADIHGAEHGEDNKVLIDAVEAAKPDVIVIAGDLIDRYQTGNPVERQLEIARTLVEGLVPIAPVYFVR